MTPQPGPRKRRLSWTQAYRCETAAGPRARCSCRCGAAGHGQRRAVVPRDLTELPAGDPHRVLGVQLELTLISRGSNA